MVDTLVPVHLSGEVRRNWNRDLNTYPKRPILLTQPSSIIITDFFHFNSTNGLGVSVLKIEVMLVFESVEVPTTLSVCDGDVSTWVKTLNRGP